MEIFRYFQFFLEVLSIDTRILNWRIGRLDWVDLSNFLYVFCWLFLKLDMCIFRLLNQTCHFNIQSVHAFVSNLPFLSYFQFSEGVLCSFWLIFMPWLWLVLFSCSRDSDCSDAKQILLTDFRLLEEEIKLVFLR